jgi:putative acetyltransferase
MGHPAKNPDLHCRPRTEADLQALTDLWVASWQKAMPQIDFEARRAWFPNHLAGLEAGGARTLCIFDAQGTMLGFVTINPKTFYLDQLAVAPQAWGSGVARRLLDEALRLSPQELMLDVNEDNQRALRFYEREGFERIGEGINALSGLKTLRLRWAPKP